MGLSLSTRIVQQPRHSYLPLCKIVGLLYSKGKLDKEHLREAINDFHLKHGSTLSYKVQSLYNVQSIDRSPGRCISYWLKINKNSVQVVSWGLEKDVFLGDEDVLNASLIASINLLSLYARSLPLLESKSSSERGAKALEKARSLVEKVKVSFNENKEEILKFAPYYFSGLIELMEGEVSKI